MLRRFSAVLALAALALAPAAALADALDAPTVELVAAGHGKLSLRVTAGPSGLPNGFAVYWMTQQDYDDYGNVWPDQLTYPTLKWAMFTGAPTLNDGGGAYTTFKLGAGESVVVEIGDLLMETGVTTNFEHELGDGSTAPTDWVVCAYALGGAGSTRSAYSLNAQGMTTLSQNCTYTIGYWKNHPSAWPVLNLTLGTVNYTQAQLLSILASPVKGNGLVSLAHQLIAAKLNVANGADPSAAAAAIAAADALIGGLVVPPVGAGYLPPSATSATTQILDDYNNGIIGPGHCGTVPAKPTTWGSIKSLYR
uniref:Uncharacterized protein n=1 Tax=Eiseniibacteriota bacterium TaxID=2212470 RepID=A0A832I693_UNCEI